MDKLKKILVIVAVFALAFSSAFMGMPTASANGTGSIQPKLNETFVEQPQAETELPERLINPVNPKETVRIIVELEGEPTIEVATNQGLLYKELSGVQREQLEAQVTQEQTEVQASLNTFAPSIKYIETFTTVFNGFSAEVEAGLVKQIAEASGVKAVYEATEYTRPEAQPEMAYSHELVQSQQVWNNYQLTGEGMIVGVIDTGIDPNHKDMVLTDDSTGALTQEFVEGKLADGTIAAGKYYTAKVPFGYNYMDGNYEILDIAPGASMHGMHVAGTVGANGNVDNGGIKGIAPEAQLLALKVFGNDPNFASTFGDIYVKAMDDAIKLGADVLNLSLGSVSGFVNENSPEQQAVGRATDNGIVVAISAGNSNFFAQTLSGYNIARASNPDYGVTGSPSVSTDSIGVASIENNKITATTFDYIVDGEATPALFLLASGPDPADTFSGEYEVVNGGLGSAEELAAVDVKGKIALIQRGTYDFVTKGKNAQAAGAVATIIYNNTAGTINMATDPAITIPYMFALQADGTAIANALNEGKDVKISFDNPKILGVDNPSKGKMSTFTSWGPTPNLDFKPEITAPGGQIFSTLDNNKYGLMSGTSMASPHVAGAAALVLQRVDAEFGLSGRERSKLAKTLLMNTALPVEMAEGEYISPRRQGAGLMQIANAIETDVIVTDTTSGEGKVALKEIQDGQFSISLQLENFGDTAQTYDVAVQLQTDYPAGSLGGHKVVVPSDFGSYVFTEGEEFTTDAPETVTVEANSTATLTFNVALTDGGNVAYIKDYFANGFYLDGFVTLTDATETVTNLVVPFFGFNGDWNQSPIFDAYRWDAANRIYTYTSLIDNNDYFITGGGTNDVTRFGFSPNGDGNADTVQPLFSLLRNARHLVVEVTDVDGNVLRTIRQDEYMTKNYANTATNPGYKYNAGYAWDGKINGKLAADGDYILQVRAKIDFEGAEWQTLQFPVKVDTVAPTVDINFDAEAFTLSFENYADNEGGTGYDVIEIFVNGEYVDGIRGEFETFQLPALTNQDVVTVNVWDAASNYTSYEFKTDAEESDEPAIYVQSPGYLSTFASNEVEVYGYVEDFSDIVSVKVHGEEATLDGTNFYHVLTLEDGVHDITIEATDKFDNHVQIARKVLVDTTAPTLKVGEYKVETAASTTVVPVTVADNFDEIRLYNNGSEVFFHDLTAPYAMKGFTNTVNVEVALVDGKNEITFEATDVAGNATSQTIVITKGEREVSSVVPPVYIPPTTTPVTPPATEAPVTSVDTAVTEQINNTEAAEVAVTVPAPTEEQPEVAAALTTATLQALAEAEKPLVITAGDTSVSVPTSVLQAAAAASPSEVVVKIAVAQAEVANSLSNVFEFTVVSTVNGQEVPVTNFAEKVTVTVPLTGTVKNVDKVAAYYVNEQTGALEYVQSKVVNGKVEFKTSHFSKFVVVENDVTFKDLGNFTWAQNYIESLASKTIIKGKDADTFAPGDNVTRAQFAALLARALDLPKAEYEGLFTDVAATASSALEIEAASRAGIIRVTDGKFRPTDSITREQLATMVIRALEYANKAALTDVTAELTFADAASVQSWAKDSVAQAAALGIISGKTLDGKQVFDPKAAATRAQAAKMLYVLIEKL